MMVTWMMGAATPCQRRRQLSSATGGVIDRNGLYTADAVTGEFSVQTSLSWPVGSG